ncbi:MAG: hypothetical protein JWP58_2519 [Hymenobacter sp.]|nr:hypothetical protein [Hymenobacter sp.]
MKHVSFFSRGWLAALLLVLFSAAPAAHAQAPAWQTAMAGGGGRITAAAADGAGNVYLLGEFSTSACTFGSLTFTNGDFHSPGPEMFLVKWNTTTNLAVWGMQSRGMGGQILATGLAVEGTNIYLTGQVDGGRAFGGTNIGGVRDATYLAKVTDAGTSGSCVWVQYVTQPYYPRAMGGFRGTALAVSGTNVYLAGRFGYEYLPTITTNFGTLSVASLGKEDGYVAKLVDAGSTGSFVWVNAFGGSGFDIAQAIAVRGADVYVGGKFEGTAAFGATTLTSAGGTDGFVAKLVDAGTTSSVAWATAVGGTATHEVRAVAVGSGGVYAAGQFSGTVGAGSTSLTSAGGVDGFMVKLADTSGSVGWSKAFGSTGYDEAVGLAMLGADVCLVGSFNGTVGLGTTTLTSVGEYDIVVAKLTDAGSTGAFAWALQAGSPSFDRSACITATSTGAVYISGQTGASVATTIQFGSIPVPVPANGSVTFLASLTDGAVSATKSQGALAACSLFPNPAHGTATVRLPPGTGPATLTLLDALGRPLRTQTAVPNSQADLDLTGLPAGLYAVRVQAGGNTATQRLVVE